MANSGDQALDNFLRDLGGWSNKTAEADRYASLPPESLELMGKQAAKMLLTEGKPLNDSIAKLASAHQDISNEQIKRICEFANTTVYLAYHDHNKTASADSSYPQYDLADASRVIQDLHTGARPSFDVPTDIEYSHAPAKKEKVASSKSEEMLAGLFGYEKQASEDYSHETAVQEVMDAKSSLNSLKDNLQVAGERFDLMLQELREQYYDMVKRHVMEGNDFSNAVAAARSTGVDEDKLASVMKPIVERLIIEKVASAHQLKESVKGLSKIAHRVVNPSHPLVTCVSEMITLETEIQKVATGLQMVEEELATVNSFIKENFHGKKTR